VILVDTSVWVDHLRAGDEALTRLLYDEKVLGHPFVMGEIALGSLPQRDLVLANLRGLPRASVATEWETLDFIVRHRLFGQGIGYVDAQLLASARLTQGAALWTRDKQLHAVAVQLGVAMPAH
jgi:predicted nucleic acid-binding protein